MSPSPQSSSLKFFGHIASPPRAKIGQALSPYESALVLINNVLTSETKAAKKELFIGTLHALSSNILRLASFPRRKSFLRGSWEKSLAELGFGKGFISAVWCPHLKNEEGIYPFFDASVPYVWSLRAWIFSTKNTIFRSISFASRLLMDELIGFGWLAKSKKNDSSALRLPPHSQWSDLYFVNCHEKMLTFAADNSTTTRNSVRWKLGSYNNTSCHRQTTTVQPRWSAFEVFSLTLKHPHQTRKMSLQTF